MNKSLKYAIFTIVMFTLVVSPSKNLNAAEKKIRSSIDQIKTELEQLKQEYLKKIGELEERIAQTEQISEAIETEVEDLAVEVSQKSNQKAANTFNPGIGMILNGRLVNSSDSFNFELPGYFLGEEAGPGDQGLQLGESELNMSANVDDKFYASSTIAFGEGAEVEEAYLQTLNLGNGFNVKFGRFFSDIGYLANKHTHTDDFSNRPLVYEAFLGGQFGDDGVQVTWLAPSDVYWESGFELFRGDSFPAAGAKNSGLGTLTVFSHIGSDIGDNQSWRAGISYLDADVDQLANEAGSNFSEGSFSGTNKSIIADFIYKWAPTGNRNIQEFKLQGEYISSDKKGTYSNILLSDAGLNYNQSGWYLEGVYRFAQQWRLGVRSSQLSSNKLPSIFDASFLDTSNHSPKQQSLMLDWTNSEFSRIRLQYDLNNLDGNNENVWILQYIAAFGAHGTHSF